jgi:hypothetical protein
MVDRTTVTPGNYTNTLGKKCERDNSRTRRKNLKQTLLGDIPLQTTAYYPMHRECKSVTDQIMSTWVKAKYPLFTREISIHCTEDDRKRKALKLIVALVGKTLPEDTITDLLANNETNADQLPLVDLFRSAGLNDIVLAQDYAELQLLLQHDQSICGLLRGGNSSVFNGVSTAHAILCAFWAKATGTTRHMYRYVVFIPLINAIRTPRGINNVPNRRPSIHCWVLGTDAHKALEQNYEYTTIDTIIGGKIFPGNDKVKALTLMSAVIVQEHLHKL